MKIVVGQEINKPSSRLGASWLYPCSQFTFNDDVTAKVLLPTLANSLYPHNLSLNDEFNRLFVNFRIDNLNCTSRPPAEEVREEFKRNGRDFEYCSDSEAGEEHIQPTRRKKPKKPLKTECVFCKNNGELECFYKGHILKDANGKTRCPVLRAYKCPICHAQGDNSHTIKYCPLNKGAEIMATYNTVKLLRNSAGKRRSIK